MRAIASHRRRGTSPVVQTTQTRPIEHTTLTRVLPVAVTGGAILLLCISHGVCRSPMRHPVAVTGGAILLLCFSDGVCRSPMRHPVAVTGRAILLWCDTAPPDISRSSGAARLDQ
jgi:hypothetical protein